MLDAGEDVGSGDEPERRVIQRGESHEGPTELGGVAGQLWYTPDRIAADAPADENG